MILRFDYFQQKYLLDILDFTSPSCYAPEIVFNNTWLKTTIRLVLVQMVQTVVDSLMMMVHLCTEVH